MSAALEPTPRKKLSLLVVQLGGLDEIFRSLMALKAIKHLYPELSISFITRAETAAPIKKVDWISHVFDIPTLRTKSESEITSANDPLTKVASWIDQIITQHYDLLVNWTYSKDFARMAAITTSLIPAYVKLGDYIRDDMNIGSYDAWSMYRQAWLQDSIEQDIHHTDIITTQLLTALQIHAGDPDPDASATAVSSRYFFKNSTMAIHPEWASRPHNLKWTAIHLDTVQENAVEFVDRVLRRHPDQGIVLLGESAQAKDQAVLMKAPRVVNLVGQIHFDQLTHLLSQCHWLISSKSPIVDLASLMNIRVVYLVQDLPHYSLKWTEDGPYGNSHLVIQADDSVNVDALYGAWTYFGSEWFHKGSVSVEKHFENLGLSAQLEKIQLFKSRIRTSQEGGGVCFEKVSPQYFTFEAWMYRVRGQMARAWFCGWLPNIEAEISRIQLNPELIKRVRGVSESIQVLEKLSHEGKGISKELEVYAEKVRAGYLMSIEDRDAIEVFGKKLMEVEALMSRVVQVEPELRAILKWYQQMMSNLQGESIAAMAKETGSIFDLLSEGVELVSVYARKTLSLAKPKAVAETTEATITPLSPN